MKKIFLAIIWFNLICINPLIADTLIPNSAVISSAKGDLNKDGRIDSVVVTEESLNNNQYYKLAIYFANKKGKMDLLLTSTTIIPVGQPMGMGGAGFSFSNVEIKKGVLLIHGDFLRGWYSHKFRFQNNKFELIGFTSAKSDGNNAIYITDYNVSTGELVESIENLTNDKTIKKTTRYIKLLVLPNLVELEIFSGDIY